MKTTRKYPALGILFKGEMVRAIQAGRKTQTRRTLKSSCNVLQPQFSTPTVHRLGSPSEGHVRAASFRWNGGPPNSEIHLAYSKYQVGDILYVKETWFGGYMVKEAGGLENELTYWYRADAPSDSRPGDVSDDWCINEFGSENKECWPRWKSSLFMPYEAARIFLKVTGVRVERLNDISEDDAKAEGATQGIYRPYGVDSCQLEVNEYARYTDGFRYIWHNINGPGSWEANPYVWVYTFERTEKPAANGQ